VDKCSPANLAFRETGGFPWKSLFQCSPSQYLYGSRGSGFPGVFAVCVAGAVQMTVRLYFTNGQRETRYTWGPVS